VSLLWALTNTSVTPMPSERETGASPLAHSSTEERKATYSSFFLRRATLVTRACLTVREPESGVRPWTPHTLSLSLSVQAGIIFHSVSTLS